MVSLPLSTETLSSCSACPEQSGLSYRSNVIVPVGLPPHFPEDTRLLARGVPFRLAAAMAGVERPQPLAVEPGHELSDAIAAPPARGVGCGGEAVTGGDCQQGFGPGHPGRSGRHPPSRPANPN